jgi:predicted ATPase
LIETDETTLRDRLSQLVDAELLYQRGRPPHATYMFKHALVQDAAYASLLNRTRQRHHQRAAQVLETHFPETVETEPELVAHHYTEAGRHEQAVAYWQQAGQRALERSANAEAVSHLTRGLEVLMEQADTPERARRELALHIALGGPLIATKGYASPEIARSTSRARELVNQVGDIEQRFAVLYRQWVYHFVTPDYQTARTLGEEFLNHAERQGDPALILMGHRILGVTQFSLGELTDARGHLEQTLSLYDPQQHRTLTFRFAQDPQVACQAFLSLVLWLLGYPEQAMRLSHDALANAHALEHINTLGYALFFGGELLALFRRQMDAVEQHTQALIALSEEQSLGFWGTYATAIDGWMQTLRGHAEHGLPQIAKGITDVQATGADFFHAFLLTLQAEAYAEDGQALEGLRMLDEALTLVDATAERLWEAEMYRLTGTLLQRSEGDGRWAEWTPEACFQKALDVARRQQARSLELRAAASLARLWQSQGKRQEAYDLLAPIYGWFTEGFDTVDLQDAKALLDKLAEVAS